MPSHRVSPIERRIPLTMLMAITAVSTVLMALAWGLYVNADTVPTIVPLLGVVLLIGIAAAVFLQGRAWQMLVNMAPTALLMMVFPMILGSLGQQITMVLLVAITVPWVSSAAVMPVYGPLARVTRNDRPAFYHAFCQIWPIVTLVALAPILFFSVAMFIIAGSFGIAQSALYFVGLLANVIFAHSLIPAQETKRFSFMFAGWLLYAVGLFLVPNLWFLVPLLGVIPQLVLMGNALTGVLQPIKIAPKEALKDTFYGFLNGSVLWADKFFLIAFIPGNEDVMLVYVALVPIVIALAMYYTTQYPVLTDTFQRLITGVNKTPLNLLGRDVARARSSLGYSLMGTVSVSVIAGLGIMLASAWIGLHHNAMSLVLFALPPVLLTLHLTILQLSQMQDTRSAALFSGMYVAVIAVAFILGGVMGASQLYALIIALLAAAAVSILAALRVQQGVTNAPFELFWQKAVAW